MMHWTFKMYALGAWNTKTGTDTVELMKLINTAVLGWMDFQVSWEG